MLQPLIITEDIVKTQILTGTLGRLYSFVYTHWLKLRLKLIILFNHQAQILTSDVLELKSKNALYYGQALAQLNYADNRSLYWQITNKVLGSLNQPDLIPLFSTRLATYLTYNYLVYADLYQKIFTKTKPSRIILLGTSPHESIANFIAQQNNIPVSRISFLQLSWLNQRLSHFFLNREHQTRLTRFLQQAKKPRPASSTLKNSILLSLDFYRHLKTLAPLYSYLEKNHHQPLFITDISNLKPSLANLNLKNAQAAYLASFLKKDQIASLLSLSSTNFPSPHISPQNLQDFLFNLSLITAKPLIINSLIMAKLYQRASQELFQTIKPKAVIVVSDARFIELSLAQQAKQKHLPSIMVSPNTMLDAAQLNRYHTTDKVVVVGNFIKHQLIKLGLDSRKIHVVGDLRLEGYQTLKQNLDKKTVYQKLGLNDLDKKILLLISFRPTWYIPKAEKQAFFRISYQAIKKLSDVVLVIKPHPTEKRYRVLEEINQWGIKDVIVSDNNQLGLNDLLSASSVVLQTWSMTVYEAIMANRPVISINPQNKDYHTFNPIIKSAGVVEVKNQKGLDHWLKILTNPSHPQTKSQLKKAKSVCAKFIKPPDGRVAQRVVKLLS